jgi:hypothetical protein
LKAAIREKLNQALIREGDIPDPNPPITSALQEIADAAIELAPEPTLALTPRKPSRRRVQEVLIKWSDEKTKPANILRRKPQALDEYIAYLLVRDAIKAKPGTMVSSKCIQALRVALDGPDKAEEDDSVRGTVNLIEKYNSDKPAQSTTEVHKTISYSGSPNRV